MTIKTILFDHDGTLVDSEPTHFQMWVDILRRLDVLLTEQQYKQHYAGIPTNANAVDMVERFKLPVNPSVLIEEKNLATRDYLSTRAFPLMPYARESLEHFFNSGIQVGIVTGAGRSGVDATIAGHDLRNYISIVVTGDDVERSKPSPDCYLLALKKLAVTQYEAVAIEDTEHGVCAATAAGITCLAVPTALSAHHNFDAAAEKFASMREATTWITQQYTL